MRPFFQLQNGIKLVHELETWKGTRFSPKAGAAAGHHANCVSGVFQVMVNVGATPDRTLPAFVCKDAPTDMQELLLAELGRTQNLVRIDDASPMLGDVAVMLSESGNPHLALYLEQSRIWHVGYKGVKIVTLTPALRSRRHSLWRFYAK